MDEASGEPTMVANLGRIVSCLRTLERPIADFLAPGSAANVIETFADAGLICPSSLEQLYAWKDGTRDNYPTYQHKDLTLFPSFWFMSSEIASQQRQWPANEFMFEDYTNWTDDWWPLFHAEGSHYIFDTTAVGADPRIYFCEQGQSCRPAFSTLEAMIETILAAFQGHNILVEGDRLRMASGSFIDLHEL